MLVFEANWTDNAVNINRLNDIVPHVRHSSLICKGDECPFAAKCSVLRSLPQGMKKVIVGTDCREERIYGVKTFVEWINNLNVSPDETPELLNLAQLVSDLILLRRIKMELAVYAHHGSLIQEKSANPKTGEIYDSKLVQHPLIDAEDRINKRIESLQKRLIASRKDKMDSMSKVKSTANFMDMMANAIAGKGFKEDEPATDAEYVVDDDE